MSSHVLRLAYFGLPLGALALARAGFPAHAVVIAHTDAPGARRLRKQLASQALILERPDLGDPSVQAQLARTRPDVILSWFYPKQIPAALLALAPRGAFGTHPSLLPRWRGPDPYFWAIYSGDAQTGVSLHRLDADYDTGPVIAQEAVAMADHENAWQLAKRLDRPALKLLVRCAERLRAGEMLPGVPQEHALATAAPAPDEGLLSIDWQQPADEIVRLVRAAAPYPGASAELGEQLVDVLDARVYVPPLPRALEPADAVWTPSGLVVRAGREAVLILRARDDSGTVWSGSSLTSLFAHPLARVHFEVDPRKTKP